MNSKYKQEVELFEKQIYELEKMNIYLKLANDVLDRRVRDRYLNHLYTIKKWHAKQECIQIAEYITPAAHLMNSSPTRSIHIFKTETNQGYVT